MRENIKYWVLMTKAYEMIDVENLNAFEKKLLERCQSEQIYELQNWMSRTNLTNKKYSSLIEKRQLFLADIYEKIALEPKASRPYYSEITPRLENRYKLDWKLEIRRNQELYRSLLLRARYTMPKGK